MIETYGSTKIYRTKFETDYEELYQRLLPRLTEFFNTREEDIELGLRGNVSPLQNGNSTLRYPTGRQPDSWPELSEYFNFIKPHIVKYLNIIGKPSNNWNMNTCWIMVYPKDSFIKEHAHSPDDNTITIMFYLKRPKNSGDLFLRTDSKGFFLDLSKVYDSNNKELDDQGIIHKIETTQGDVIIQTGDIPHWTSASETDEEKVSIIIDLCYKNSMCVTGTLANSIPFSLE